MTDKIPVLDRGGLRQFGLTTGAIVAVLFGVVFPYFLDRAWPVWPWIVFAVLIAWALIAPASLNPVYRGWMQVGLLLSRITTPIILTLVFFVAIFPGSLLMRLFHKDPMRRSFNESVSYRVESRQPSVKNLEKPY